MNKKKKEVRTGKNFSTEKISDILPAMCESMALDTHVRDMAVLRLWPKLLPDERFVAASQALSIRRVGAQHVLMVRVSDASLATELGFYRDAMREAINAFAPQTGLRIDDIRMHVGHIK